MNNLNAWVRRKFARRHRYTPEILDVVGYPHPRPASDPRLVCLHIALPWVALVQVLRGPAPSTVQAQAFSYVSTIAFSALLAVSCGLVLYAAFCNSQYWSWGWELAGCTGFTFVFGIYSLALISVINDWYTSTGAAWSLAFFVGNAIRAGILVWRMW